MKRFLLAIIYSFLSLNFVAQRYDNEWINFSQQYFKFPIYKEGICRIDSATLSKHYNLNAINPKNFQLFFVGKEVTLYVKGESDNKVNTGDYLEFYANPRPGDVDSLLYQNIKYVPSPYNALFNDTIYAFLTINNSTTNKRFTEETDTTSSLYQNTDYFFADKIATKFYHNGSDYNPMPDYPGYGSDPNYFQGDGWGNSFGTETTISNSISTGFSNLNPYTLSQQLSAKIVISLAGDAGRNSVPDHHLISTFMDINNNSKLLFDTIYRGARPIKTFHTINATEIGTNSDFIFKTSSVGLGVNKQNYHAIFYAYLHYPHSLDLAGNVFQKMSIPDAILSSKSFLRFTNFNNGTTNSVLFYDITNSKKITTVLTPGAVRAVIPNGNSNKLCVLAGESNIRRVDSILPVNGNGYFKNYKTSNVSKPILVVYNRNLFAGVSDYANYRKSPQGGGYDVILADEAALSEQFAYGNNKNPVGIRNFIKLMFDSLNVKPLSVFIIGKGVGHQDIRAGFLERNYVASLGFPASDYLFTAALSATNTNYHAPEVAVGRLAVTNNTEVGYYLDKVKQHELADTAAWKKNILHCVGGDSEALIRQLDTYMTTYSTIAVDTAFGANVSTFKKNTTAPIQTNVSDSIYKQIDAGVSLISFFGHGGMASFDFAVDDPVKYNNFKKYPLMLANSCNTGYMFHPYSESVSERMVKPQNKGVIGFIGTTSFEQDNLLFEFSKGFYKAISNEKFRKSMGEVVKHSIEKTSVSNDSLLRFVGLEMSLNGDPEVVIGPHSKPDFQIRNNFVQFDLQKYTDSLGINLRILNSGKAVSDSFSVKILRTFPNGDTISINKIISSPKYFDSLKVYTLIDSKRGYGLNSFSFNVDFYDKISEYSENNNQINNVEIFIPGGDIFPVYPYKYAIVPKTNTLILKASTSDPFSPQLHYIFQLDTNDKFLTPLQSTVITSKGGVLEWKINLPYKDSTVYFWRVSRDSNSSNPTYSWRESSFQTIGLKRGWGQAHFNQFKNDGYKNIDYRKDVRKFLFQNSVNSIFCKTGVFQAGVFTSVNLAEQSYYFNNQKMDDQSCTFNGWNFAVFDSVTGQPQEVRSLSFPAPGMGPLQSNCCTYEGIYHVYSYGPLSQSTLNWQANIENFINSIAHGNYVLAYPTNYNTGGVYNFSQYSPSLIKAFQDFGAGDELSQLSLTKFGNSIPLIYFGKKGMKKGQAHVELGQIVKGAVYLTDSITARWKSGTISSEFIGPSKKWNSLHWRAKGTDTKAGDTTRIKIVGITKEGKVDTIVSFRYDSTDIFSLDAYINAYDYPYIKLVAFVSDYVNSTAPQLNRWQVLYDEAPECAINPLKGYAAINDSLQQGDVISFRVPIENIGIKNFEDTLVINYWIEDNQHTKTFLPHKLRPDTFKPGQIFIDTVKFNSQQFNGSNLFWLYVNPRTDLEYQHEQHQFNNIARIPFKVTGDVTNPLLDVTFDGIRILNGDIVSAKPDIYISLKDENKFLAMNDTSAFNLWIKYPNQNTNQPIYFAQGLNFTPANLPKNSASILYNPTFTQDGKYTLIIKAKDRSNNKSGASDFNIQFEVINHPSVTNVLNYPNPFTSNTKFVFTLTGSEVPEVFTIQIMTVTGKIVKEITRSELGNLHIGRNITDFGWDGKDRFGDNLGNGVYLYRVITKLNGENIDKSSSGADKYFTKEMGKMVLMR